MEKSIVAQARISTGIERRKFPRIKDNSPLFLYSREIDKVYPLRNISCGGLCFEGGDKDIPAEESVRAEVRLLDRQSRSTRTLPASLKVIWSKRTGKRYRCGAEFVQIKDENRAVVFEKIEQEIKREKQRAFKKEFIGRALLIIATLGGIALFIFQYTTFNSVRNSLETALAYTERERVMLKSNLESAIKEKEAYRIELDNTKTLLAQAGELLKSERSRFNARLEFLTKNIERLTNEVKRLSKKNLILEYRLHNLKELRSAIHSVKRETHLKKTKIQRKLDRIKSLHGNKGYVVKNSKSTLGAKSVIIRVLPAEIKGVPNYELK